METQLVRLFVRKESGGGVIGASQWRQRTEKGRRRLDLPAEGTEQVRRTWTIMPVRRTEGHKGKKTVGQEENTQKGVFLQHKI